MPEQTSPMSWSADNGNGTFSNPLFFDEFSDPDMIRVGDDYYLTGTTMHTSPGLPVLHSNDLVNWTLMSYASDRLDLGPEFRLDNGKDIYGRGIWAPSFRHHNGTFYIFANVTGHPTLVFTSRKPSGPWKRTTMKRGFHDLSVLFDDDGRKFVAWGYRDIRIAQLNETLDDIIPGTEHAPFGRDSTIGEGAHFLKINGMYYIISAWYAGGFRMPCARAKNPYGPYEIIDSISTGEAFGITQGYRLKSDKGGKFDISAPDPSRDGIATAIHQGGIVDTKSGEWWGYSMMDANSIGRLTCLSPITWVDGWPMFGLPGNIGRTPRTWVKPATGSRTKPSSPYTRSDSFKGPTLANVWQWNHHPDDTKWSLKTRRGWLSLTPQSSPDFWRAKNTLTQRAIGPKSSVTVTLDATRLVPGDIAGLGLLNHPYGWIGIRRAPNGEWHLTMFCQESSKETTVALPSPVMLLRAECDFLTEIASFSWSVDGLTWQELGSPFRMVFQLRTFQGVRYALFAYNTLGNSGGRADFRNFSVNEPAARGLMHDIPGGQIVKIENATSGATLTATGSYLSSTPSAVD
ncbi:MAG: glycoside hydrolase 43 family protein, partial [Armatimonadaceae bacterium]